jgi:hypothetical protein
VYLRLEILGHFLEFGSLDVAEDTAPPGYTDGFIAPAMVYADRQDIADRHVGFTPYPYEEKHDD